MRRPFMVLLAAAFVAAAAIAPAGAAQTSKNGKAQAFELKSELLAQHADVAAALDQVEAEPENAEAWRALGQALAERAGFTDAIRALTQAVKIAPDDANAWADLGTAYIRAGAPGKAKGPLNRALKIEPFHAIAQYNLGVAHQALGEYDASLDAFERAILINPSLADPRVNAGVLINPDLPIVQHRVYMQTSGSAFAPFSPKPASQTQPTAMPVGGASQAR